MDKHQGLIEYAIQLASPAVSSALHKVCQQFECNSLWSSPQTHYRPAQQVQATASDNKNRAGYRVSVDGEVFLGENVWRLDQYDIRAGWPVGRVRLNVSAHINFGVMRGNYIHREGVKYLLVWARPYRTKYDKRLAIIDTMAGQLAISLDDSNAIVLAGNIEGELSPEDGNNVILEIPECGFTDNDDSHRFDRDKWPFSGLTSTDPSGRRWEVEAQFGASGAIVDKVVGHYNRRLEQRDDIVTVRAPLSAIWLPEGPRGPAVSLPALRTKL